MKTDYSTARICSYDPIHETGGNRGGFQSRRRKRPGSGVHGDIQHFSLIDNHVADQQSYYYDQDDEFIDSNCVPTLKLEPG